MAFGTSGLYVANWIDILDATQLAINLVGDTVKCAMYTDTLTPNFSSNTIYSATNEVSGAGYTSGGATLASKTVTESPTGTLMFDAADVAFAASTITAARGAIVYDTTVSNSLIVAITFGADFSTTAGTFTIQWSALGIFTIDLTP